MCAQMEGLAYKQVEPGDSEGFAAALERLASSAGTR